MLASHAHPAGPVSHGGLERQVWQNIGITFEAFKATNPWISPPTIEPNLKQNVVSQASFVAIQRIPWMASRSLLRVISPGFPAHAVT
jgi:hypothetical protein